ncbi:MAG: DUF3987 domain-containing protein, partial [Akkermansiaceae bacterium]
SASTSASWSELLNDLLEFYRESKTVMSVALSSEALKLLRDESNRVLRQGKDGAALERLSSYVARYGENLRKLHLLLHVAEHGTKAHTVEAGAESARNAIQIARWFFRQTLDLLQQGMSSKLQKKLDKIVTDIGKIEDGKPKEITLGVMLKRHTTTERDIRELQYFFPNVLEIADRKHPDGGRPTQVVRLAEG